MRWEENEIWLWRMYNINYEMIEVDDGKNSKEEWGDKNLG